MTFSKYNVSIQIISNLFTLYYGMSAFTQKLMKMIYDIKCILFNIINIIFLAKINEKYYIRQNVLLIVKLITTIAI